MANAQKAVLTAEQKSMARQKTWNKILRDKWMYLLLLPGFLYFLIFKIFPLWGILISFKAYYAGLDFWRSEWVGLQNFIEFFAGSDFLRLLKNTLVISFMNLLFYFPLPIILSLLLNEIKVQWYKSVLQTMVYVPHFVSMVVIASISFMILKTPTTDTASGGALYEVIKALTGKKVDFLTNPNSIYWDIPCGSCRS